MNQFQNYEILYDHLKSFEQRFDGWEFSYKPKDHFEFPKDETIDGENFFYPNETDDKLPKMSELIKQRKSTLTPDFSKDISIAELLAILKVSIGKNGSTRQLSEYYNNHRLDLRAYPSGGAMYSVKIYLFIENVVGCKDGLYVADGEKLALVRPKKDSDNVTTLFPIIFSNKVKVTCFFLADFEYSFPKYGYLSYQLAMLEAGHIAQNLQLASAEIDKDSLPVGGFYADRITKFLGLYSDKFKHCIYTFLIG